MVRFGAPGRVKRTSPLHQRTSGNQHPVTAKNVDRQVREKHFNQVVSHPSFTDKDCAHA